MDYKFKTGDRVRIVQRKSTNSYGAQDWSHKGTAGGDIGKIGTITDVDHTIHPYRVEQEGVKLNAGVNPYLGWFDGEEIELATHQAKPELPPKFILQYECNEDRFELFPTLPAAKVRIKKLLSDNTVKRNSFCIYEIKKMHTVKVSETITLSSK